MVPIERHQFDLQQLVTKWFARGEVKTPLAFFFKVLPWLAGVWGLVLYSPLPSDLKVYLIKLAVWLFGGMFVFVGLFAWFRPRHLVYGETSHRAEHKLEFGTDKKSYTAIELDELPSAANSQQLEAGSPPEQP